MNNTKPDIVVIEGPANLPRCKYGGTAFVEHAHYGRIYMGQLRRKLEADPTHRHYLLTEAGLGYRLEYCE